MNELQRHKISFFFPCYNEEDNIESLVTASEEVLRSIASEYEIIIVNDGSSDRTAEKTEELMKNNSHIKLVNHEVNSGYGSALTSGITSSRHDLIFFSDGDLQFDLKEIGKFLEKIDKYDYIIGYRINRKDNLIRRFNAGLWNLVLRLTTGLKVKDVDCAFKLFHKYIFDQITINSKGAFASAEILLNLKERNYRYTQIGVNHYPRVKGTQTGGNPLVIFKAIKELLKFKFKR
ncbi:MAG: glycosyltransferase family 2 protein [bacterium]|nr:glycosyltransferase family 2 protein [bacterium]